MPGEQLETQVMDAVAKSVSHWDKVLDTVIEYAIRFGKNILIALIVYFIASRLIKWVLKLTTKALNKGKIEPIVVKFIYSIIKVGLYVLLFIAIVSILGIPTTTFVTLFGTVTLSVGLALQGSLANFAGGVLILIFKPFKVGDYIVACGDEGTVVGIDVFYTKLATVDNKMIVIPNGTLANSSVKNVSAMDIRRVDVQVGISYEPPQRRCSWELSIRMIISSGISRLTYLWQALTQARSHWRRACGSAQTNTGILSGHLLSSTSWHLMRQASRYRLTS